MTFGACSRRVFKKTTTTLTSMDHASSSATSPQVENMVVKMEACSSKEQMNSLLA